jgi:hypothetical protein
METQGIASNCWGWWDTQPRAVFVYLLLVSLRYNTNNRQHTSRDVAVQRLFEIKQNSTPSVSQLTPLKRGICIPKIIMFFAGLDLQSKSFIQGFIIPNHQKDTRLYVSKRLFVFFWGRHIGLHPTWNYLIFKQSCKSFNPKNHSSNNLREENAFTMYRDVKHKLTK